MAEGHFETINCIVDVDGTTFELVRATMRESISQISTLDCEVTLTGGPPEPSGLLGKPGFLEVKRKAGTDTRSFHGIVIEAVRSMDSDGRPITRLTIAPRLWKTTKRRDCRIFQEKTTKDIVSEVLDEAGVTDYSWNLTASYEPRVYCAQYRETDYDFIARLLAEEGIIFSITHDEGIDKLTFGDDGTGFGDVEPATIPFATLQGFDTAEASVTDLERQRSVVSDKIFLRDYDFERPKYKLEKESESSDDGTHALEVYCYPGRVVEDGTAQRYAKVLLDSIQATRDTITGDTTLLTLKPG